MQQNRFNKLLPALLLLPLFFDYRVDLKKQTLKLYWKDDNNQPLRSIQNLKAFVEKKGEKLVFAMNAGMYKTDNSPLGLFINDGKQITALNTRSASGNFYLKPNGVFYITKNNTAAIVTTPNFKNSSDIKYATQSGPMLVIDGKIHPGFTKGSSISISGTVLEFYQMAKCYLSYPKPLSISMILPNTFKRQGVRMLYSSMDLYQELICRHRIGCRQMVTLG